MLKKLSYLVLFMAGIQLLRMGIEQLVFLVVARTYFTDHVATMIAMITMAARTVGTMRAMRTMRAMGSVRRKNIDRKHIP